MAADLSFHVREEVIAFLRASGPFTAVLAATQIFGEIQPPDTPYPFLRYGSATQTPLEYSCQNGSTITADLHIFTDDEATAGAIGGELIAALDGQRILIPTGGSFDCRWTAGQNLRDPLEADIFHWVRTFEFEAGL